MDALRKKLVTDHLDIARSIAHKCAADFNLLHLFDDLLGYAHQGLVEAASRFSPSADNTFSTFCWARVRGAVIDGIRKTHSGRQKLQPEDGAGAGRPVHIAYDGLRSDRREQIELRTTGVEDAEGRVDGSRQRRALLEALAALPDAQRQIVVRKHCRNEPIHEIASDLGIHRSHAARQHMAGLRTLRAALDGASAREACQ